MWLPQAASELTFASLIQAICSFHHANDTNGNHGLFNRWMFLSWRQIVLSRLMLCAMINTWEKSFLGGKKKLSHVPSLLASRQRGGLPCTPYLWGLNLNRGRTIHPRKDRDRVVGRLNPAHSDSISGASLSGQGWFILSYEVSKTGCFYLEFIQIPSLNTNVHFNYFS